MKSTYKNLSLLGIALPPIGSKAMPSKEGLTHFSEHSRFSSNLLGLLQIGSPKFYIEALELDFFSPYQFSYYIFSL